MAIALFCLLLLPVLIRSEECGIEVSLPRVTLTDVPFTVSISLPPFLPGNETIPELVWFSVEGATHEDLNNTLTRDYNGTSSLIFTLKNVIVDSSGYHTLEFNFSRNSDTSDSDQLICPPIEQTLLAIPGILTLVAPVVTALLAIIFRQVMIALLVGIWICASFANEYNPLAGIVRTLDMYIVNSLASPGHAAIIVFTFFLGGVIGVVQRSGGGIGLARMLYRFTNSRRKATIVCVSLCLLIFFDDYSAVLIPGNSLRSVMNSAGVSKEKFAYILQSVGPALASTVPVSSWIGVQVGYVHSAFDNAVCKPQCNGTYMPEDFILVVETIPYRFFPLLILFCVVLVSVLGRDFGPMLTAERRVTAPPSTKGQGDQEAVTELKKEDTPSEQKEAADDFTGPLAPKKGVPYRWYNAAVPFLLIVVTTLVGMVLGGRQAILDQPEDQRKEMNIVNIFTMADSVAALIWASCLASAVLFIMLRLQKILKMSEFMEAWVEGVKDIIEPLLILLLAWALGAAIQDTHTNTYIAQVLQQGGVSVNYVPVIVTIIGFVLAFATGSAFGTMGLLFPLVIPTVCQLAPCQQGPALQATASILSSSIFGNAISPIADITILTTVASKCELGPHIKTSLVYVFLVGTVSVLFGSLPVGAGWYPWYAAWIIMPAILCLFFILFSANFTVPESRSLVQRVCPCAYTVPERLFKRLQLKWGVLRARFPRIWRRSQRNQLDQSVSAEVNSNIETAPLLPQPNRRMSREMRARSPVNT